MDPLDGGRLVKGPIRLLKGPNAQTAGRTTNASERKLDTEKSAPNEPGASLALYPPYKLVINYVKCMQCKDASNALTFAAIFLPGCVAVTHFFLGRDPLFFGSFQKPTCQHNFMGKWSLAAKKVSN